MSRGSEQRERILDALEDILITDGERAATVEKVAERSGITRGGLVYHFASREDLLEAFMERLRGAGERASAQLLSAPEGAVERYILSAAPPMSDVDKTILAATRLATPSRPEVRELLIEMHRQWVRVLAGVTGDVALARLMLLIGDGIFFHTIMTGQPFVLGGPGAQAGQERDELMGLVKELLSRGGDRGNRGLLG